ncbi:MAG: CotH kinase family protein [Bacteroides sp.]|nr:CotH kinase family protein [Bacteroides sp.]MCM1378768.1 CotH kinase family protein [Bacteroides sp.]MCM1445385.1 CotH kinase family protein [Prevotella sp.]
MKQFIAALLFAASLTATAQDPWLHIYYPKGNDYRTYDMSTVVEVTFDETDGSMIVTDEEGETQKFYGSYIDFFRFGPNVPAIHIDIPDQPYLDDVKSKTDYLDGILTFEGRGHQDDYEMDVKVRGRGNSTWGYSKKPYRLKFVEKQRLMLPKKAKNFVLLANYIDGAMMRNFAAFKFGESIEMPWINHTEPVDVYFNGNYKGSYMLTEKVGFNNGSVNIKAADEPNSALLELDNCNVSKRSAGDGYYDSDKGQWVTFYRDTIIGPSDEVFFVSAPFRDPSDGEEFVFPVNIKDPDAPEDPAEQAAWVKEWKADFDRLMTAVRQGDTQQIFELCDLESLVRYMMVFDFACNQEIDHPKSVYMYKTKGGKWIFGPCWDFDWAFGYNPTYSISGAKDVYTNPLLGVNYWYSTTSLDGYAGYFFKTLCDNKQFKDRFEQVWTDFVENRQEQFWADFDAYAEKLRPSANNQGLARSSYKAFDYNVEALRTWIKGRIQFITEDENHGLWDDASFSGYYYK